MKPLSFKMDNTANIVIDLKNYYLSRLEFRTIFTLIWYLSILLKVFGTKKALWLFPLFSKEDLDNIPALRGIDFPTRSDVDVWSLGSFLVWTFFSVSLYLFHDSAA